MATHCPSCGSDQLETITKKHSMPIVYGSAAEWNETIQHCLVCDESGDFSGDNDAIVNSAIELAKKQSISTMLDSLTEAGIKMAYMERALELAPRTIARWKTGGASAASIALLRIICTYPWIVDVADANFEARFALRRLIQEAASIFYHEVESNTKSASMSLVADTDKVSIYASLQFDNSLLTDNIMIPTMVNLSKTGE